MPPAGPQSSSADEANRWAAGAFSSGLSTSQARATLFSKRSEFADMRNQACPNSRSGSLDSVVAASVVLLGPAQLDGGDVALSRVEDQIAFSEAGHVVCGCQAIVSSWTCNPTSEGDTSDEDEDPDAYHRDHVHGRVPGCPDARARDSGPSPSRRVHLRLRVVRRSGHAASTRRRASSTTTAS